MAKSRKYFRKNKIYKKTNKLKIPHTNKKSRMRKKKIINKSKRYRLKGGGNFSFIPQDLVNIWWNTEHGINKMINNWKGLPTEAGPLPTDQPELLKTYPIYEKLPDLQRFNEKSDLQVSKMLK